MPERQKKILMRNDYKNYLISLFKASILWLNIRLSQHGFSFVFSIVDKQKVICILQTRKRNMSTRIHYTIVLSIHARIT